MGDSFLVDRGGLRLVDCGYGNWFSVSVSCGLSLCLIFFFEIFFLPRPNLRRQNIINLSANSPQQR